MKTFFTLLISAAVLSASPLIVTSVPALESIAKELTAGTDLRVVNPVKGEYAIPELPEVIKSKAADLDTLAKSVTAVISLRSIMEEDQLYTQLRQSNIRIVEIDAAVPLNPSLTAIGQIRNEQGVNPHIWLAPSAVIRASEIIAKDLELLFPENRETIESNLQKLREQIRLLVNEYETKFSEIEQFSAVTMDRSFDYLTKDLGLFITMEFPGEMSWTESDYSAFRKGIADHSFAVILHRWVPFGDMASDAEKAKIPFAVIETGFPGGTLFDKGITGFLKSNCESIFTALKK